MTEQLPVDDQPTLETAAPLVDAPAADAPFPGAPVDGAPFVGAPVAGAPAVEPIVQAPVDAPVEASAPAAPPPAATETVTCPECGAVATVTLNRRESHDFCRNCDYPLFWTPSKVFIDRAGAGDDSLRRLPGTVGRATVASITCPHCAEPNAVAAVVCIRCGRSLQPEAPPPPPPPPPPQPVYVPPPPVQAPPERDLHWLWFIAAFVVVLTGILVVLFVTHTIG